MIPCRHNDKIIRHEGSLLTSWAAGPCCCMAGAGSQTGPPNLLVNNGGVVQVTAFASSNPCAEYSGIRPGQLHDSISRPAPLAVRRTTGQPGQAVLWAWRTACLSVTQAAAWHCTAELLLQVIHVASRASPMQLITMVMHASSNERYHHAISGLSLAWAPFCVQALKQI